MNELTGMDISHIRSMAREMTSEADDIWSTLQRLSQELQSAPWQGPDRQRFIDEWNSRHAAALGRVVDSLRSAAAQARRYADQQEWASRA